MEVDIYQTPTADLSMADDGCEFYRVGIFKLWVLSIATLGIYQYYWSYRHWRQIRDYHSGSTRFKSIWPLARGIFDIFFVFSLFNFIDLQLAKKDNNQSWSPRWQAGLFMFFSLAGNIIGNLDLTGTVAIAAISFSFIAMLIVIATMQQAQLVANTVCAGKQTDANNRLGLLNYLWISLGLVVWAFAAFGMLVMTGAIHVD